MTSGPSEGGSLKWQSPDASPVGAVSPMNVAGVFLLRFIGSLQQSAEAQAAFAVSYTELFSLITWSSVGLMGATAAVAGQNLGAGHPDRSVGAVHAAARMGFMVAAMVGIMFLTVPRALLGVFGMDDPVTSALGCADIRGARLQPCRAGLEACATGTRADTRVLSELQGGLQG